MSLPIPRRIRWREKLALAQNERFRFMLNQTSKHALIYIIGYVSE